MSRGEAISKYLVPFYIANFMFDDIRNLYNFSLASVGVINWHNNRSQVYHIQLRADAYVGLPLYELK